jgi:hypothetical protein
MLPLCACLFCISLHQAHSSDDTTQNSGFNSEKSLEPQFLPLTRSIVEKFSSLTWDDKVPYIFTEDEWGDLVDEFHLISEDNPRVGYEAFISNFEEFSDPSKVIEFWQGCDIDKDRYVTMQEYAFCRGDFDQNGEPYDVNEYEYREANLLANFKPFLKYDEDGIIIDD